MTVVSNSSLLISLFATDMLWLLQTELLDPRHAQQKSMLNISWLDGIAVTDHTRAGDLQRHLDPGEAEAIVLAQELGAELILLDEEGGRSVARRIGLNAVGVLGILLSAKLDGLISEVRRHLDALRTEAGFYVSDALYEDVVQLAGE